MCKDRRHWTIAASLLWAAVLILILLRAGIHPARPNSLTTYLTGGSAWAASQPLYMNWRGFVYPPPIAWFFSLFAHLPLLLSALLWHILTAAVFLAGLVALLRSGVFHRIPHGSRGLVFLGVLPLSIGNLDNSQANPLIIGLMMLSVAAMASEAWTLCALAISIATAFKVYPLALALLLCLLRPRQLAWRIALLLLLLALLPFLFQSHSYVSSQYHAWLQTRLADDRLHYTMKDAPLDLWYLLVRLGHLPIPPRAYMALQLLAGAAIAACVLFQTRRAIPESDILATLFLLVSVWILLLGPATENQTFIVLAPAACLLAVERPGILSVSAFSLLLAAVARNSLLPHLKSPVYMAIQPVAALILLGAIVACRRPDPTPHSLR